MIVPLLPCILALLLPSASSWPLNADPLFEDLAKRLEKPPVPGASDLRPHIAAVPSSSCMFYTGGTVKAAQEYADANDLYLLGDLDEDGWVRPSQEDEFGNEDYSPQCPMSWAFQEPYKRENVGWGEAERDAYFDSLSEAFSQKCTGVITLALPPNREIPSDSVFARVEWPALKFNPTVTMIRAVVLNRGEGGDANGTPLDGPYVYWRRCGST
jgi:hypothetical protein